MKKLILTVILVLSACAGAYAGPWPGPTVKQSSRYQYFMPTGFTFDAILVTAIFSFNTITPVIAQCDTDIVYLDTVMIPKGTRFIGSCSVEKTVDRVNIRFHRMVFPNGYEQAISAIALHTDGSGGVPGKISKQKARLPAKILLNAAATTATLNASNSVSAEMIKGIADDTNQELAQKQDYSITIKKNVAIQLFNIERVEY